MSLWDSRVFPKTRVRPHGFKWIHPIRRIGFLYTHWTWSKSQGGAHFSQTWTKKVFDTSVGAKPTSKLHAHRVVTIHLGKLLLFLMTQSNHRISFFQRKQSSNLNFILLNNHTGVFDMYFKCYIFTGYSSLYQIILKASSDANFSTICYFFQSILSK